jgi:hypothetical protein
MNNQIDRIVEDVRQQLTYEELKIMLARLQDILDEIEDEREWDEIVAKPHVKKYLEEQGQIAWKEHLEGNSEEGGFGCL